ncbi:hypothetical protein PF010_g26270, partial [Phytophthora fragariae]
LPGVVTPDSGNPDLAKGKNSKVSATKYYPTWPGIWMMGNLGRAIFSASTNRMWPFSYDKCEPDLFDTSYQRISACNDNPGYGLNPNQGRGAPEIDVLEGGATLVSSSLQIGPGMPDDYRIMGLDLERPAFVYLRRNLLDAWCQLRWRPDSCVCATQAQILVPGLALLRKQLMQVGP